LITITRSDLKSDGYLLPQTSHSIADFAYEHPEVFRKWKKESNSIICLSCESEKQLLKIYEKYSELTPTVKFFEPDIDQWTSICLYGTKKIRNTLTNLPLALKNKSFAI
jgi:hypothetical protein